MRQETKNQTAKLNAWDTSYFCDLLEEKKFGRSEEGLWNYFEVNHVVGETLKIYQELLGLKFTELEDAQTWHPDVRVFEVKDKN